MDVRTFPHIRMGYTVPAPSDFRTSTGQLRQGAIGSQGVRAYLDANDWEDDE